MTVDFDKTSEIGKQIYNFLSSKHWNYNENNEWTTSATINTGAQMIINGEVIPQTIQQNIYIKYLGSGLMWDVCEESITIYGFNINGSEDFWVESLQDFIFWYEKYINTNVSI